MLAVLFSFVCFAIWRGGKVSSRSSSVAVLVAENPRDFASTLARMGKPAVVKDTIIKEWQALKKWSPSFLASRVGKFSGVYVNNNRWFGPYYDGRKPLTKYCPRTNPYLTDLVVPAEDFFKLLAKPNHGEYMYFTGDVDKIGVWAFDHVQPIEELLRLNPKSSSVNVWIGQPHVLAHCHYDGYHNFYAQLYGHKRFKLYHPSNWPGLYPYPFLHPSHAQAQVNLSHAGSRRKFPAVEKVEWFEAELGPGDLLYIPPLWFHEVEALDVSISVNVWTDPPQASVMTDVFSVPIPFEHIKNKNLRSLCAAYTIHKLLATLCKKKKCSTQQNDPFLLEEDREDGSVEKSLYFVRRLWRTRYRSIMKAKQIPVSLPKGINCQKSDVAKSEVIEGLNGLDGFLTKVTDLVVKIPTSTWEIWTGNYIEFLSSVAVGPENVGAFLQNLQQCLL